MQIDDQGLVLNLKSHGEIASMIFMGLAVQIGIAVGQIKQGGDVVLGQVFNAQKMAVCETHDGGPHVIFGVIGGGAGRGPRAVAPRWLTLGWPTGPGGFQKLMI